MGFGLASVVLALYLIERGFTKPELGMLLSATLIQDAILTTSVSALASRLSSRHLLFLSSAVMFIGAMVLAFAQDKWILAIAVICGIISPAGFEGGPFAALEQSIVAKTQQASSLTKALSIYNMLGFGGAALGALLAGILLSGILKPASTLQAYQTILMTYALCGPILAVLYGLLKTAVGEKSDSMSDVQKTQCAKSVHAHDSKPKDQRSDKLTRLWQFAALQSMDAFGGGFIVQSLLTLWFYQQYQLDAIFLGSIFFWCNIIAAFSFMLAPAITKRIGLLQTMVFTHLPCSLTLCLLPFLPSKEWAAGLLIARSFFSSMDIPVRQAYSMLIVAEKDRAFAAGLTSSSRAIAQSISPSISGFLMQNFFLASPLICAGIAKSAYDVLLYFAFKNVPLDASRNLEDNEPGTHQAPPIHQGRKATEKQQAGAGSCS